ncbi:MoxR-like ATPase [Mariprofundus ferrinatatus]|uniref:MoxR-like ATPase n=1 Tax=Mariprofundus ferrinatatus TaxID=1921087 RepID=A0A2K8L5M6_9PROT|nr:AAA family ATPase [Mariprofundus ferrinatatus]ATX82625.1 MoxR-like ATPase [Mariprofundus ferrinatatus]
MNSSFETIAVLQAQLASILAGKDGVIRQLLITLLSGGHLLIEDVPGVGKTTLAHALANSLDSDFGRIQFTADLLPADIVGVEIFDPAKQQFDFHPGAVFHHIVLADEINRATPKAQSALLEAMAEGQVTIERETRRLPQPFFVIATQNPNEHMGTFPLPESQLDRFFMRISIGYPDSEAERKVLLGEAGQVRLHTLQPVANWHDILAARQSIAELDVSEALLDYLLKLLEESRSGEWLKQGISPRAGHDLMRAARAEAWLAGQSYVTAADLQSVWLSCLAHRVLAAGDSVEALAALLESVPVPA